ncbi:adenylyl cyclase-associated protein 2-like [Acipenser oxyrinchus oxyrinchus]|uniref:Adenylyl cyclase-associated protein 2-like n=1 Tax=Acipenser oxyrinchus oxyrinchus TaxID=40147 RepID=A0AAD8GEE6_ACIOX|nr:adenylyl cyclase-associated protein 2-like [Acipenser oxyrinchus oxyrinchus]
MAEIESLVERLEMAVVRLETVSSKFHGSALRGGDIVNGVDGDLAPCVEAYDALLSTAVVEYLKNSKAIGEDVEKHAEMVNAAFQAQRGFVKLASTHQQPPEADLATLLRPISMKIQEIQNFREKNRGSKMFNHLSAVSESIPALGWIAMAPKPGPYVKEMNDSATFYTNRVLKDYKDNDNRHVDWVRSYLQLWTELQAYIKEHHTTGLVWSKRGPFASELSQVAPPAHGPCPPPPPPPPIFEADTPKNNSSTMHSALFAELNQGEAITRGKDRKYWLRHVLDGQKTHKNPELRSQGGVARQSPTKSHTPSPTSPKPPPQNHFPVLELEGKKWRVEYQDHANSLVISETELKHVVYTFKCSNSTLQIKGKINSIIVDSCKKLGLVFDNVVGIVEVINSRDIQIQVLGKVPTISVNKTEGCHIYLSEESFDCEIVSAKTSEVNILVPQDGDYKEFPVPEQYKTVWDGSKLVTEPTEMAG